MAGSALSGIASALTDVQWRPARCGGHETCAVVNGLSLTEMRARNGWIKGLYKPHIDREVRVLNIAS